MDKQRAIQLALIGAVVVLGGIILSVLLQQMIVIGVEGHVDNFTTQWSDVTEQLSGRVWVFGLVYIIPGIMGIIAAFVQNKCMYVTTCIFTFISVFIMGIIFLFAGLALIAIILINRSVSENCVDTAVSGCMCRNAYDNYESTSMRTCADVEKFRTIFISLLVFIVLTWVAEVVQFIVAAYFSCKSTTRQGGVILSSPQPLLPRGEMASPGYDMDYPYPSKV